MRLRKRNLSLGLSIAATAAFPAPGYAQVASPATGQPGASGEATAGDADEGIKDIIVTAQRREETVQKSSVTIQVLGADTLSRAGVTQAKDLGSLVPGLQIAQGGAQAQTFIRGVGDFSSTALGQSAVAYNYEGVYIGDQTTVQPLFYDLARVEVLKGPQGTLYGRNSSAGAINVIVNRPSLSGISGNATVEYGNFDAKRVTAALNVPLSATIAVRGAFNIVDRDGYLSDGSDDDKQRSGRLQLLFKPGSRFSALIGGDLEHRYGVGPGAVLSPRQPGNGKFTGQVDPLNNAALIANSVAPPIVLAPGSGVPPRAPGTALVQDSFIDSKQQNVNAEFNYDFGPVVLTFVPAYRHSTIETANYIGGIPVGNQESASQQSYELRLSHSGPRLKAVAGLFYLDMDRNSAYQAYVSRLLANQNSFRNQLGTKSYAGFAQATFSVTPEFRVIAGGRYTKEDRSIDGSRQTLSGPLAIFVNDATFKAFTYRAGVEYDVASANMLYATVSKGFKSGGFNTFQATPGFSNVYQPEKLNAYTIGMRNRFLDNRLQLNLEGYYWDYKDSQQTHFAFDPTGALQFLTFNAASATSYGFEADFVFRPVPADTFSATLAFNHTKFDSFVYNIPAVRFDQRTTGCPGSISGTLAFIDCSGFPLPRAPKWSGSVSYQHRFELSSGSSVVAGADVNFGGKRYTAVDYLPVQNAPAFFRQNAQLTFAMPDDRFSITGFIKNISNEEVRIGGIEAALTPGFVYDTVDAPRTYGIRLQTRF